MVKKILENTKKMLCSSYLFEWANDETKISHYSLQFFEYHPISKSAIKPKVTELLHFKSHDKDYKYHLIFY